MSTSGRADDGPVPAASDVAADLREADFVRVLARADGDCLAAAGLLARALTERSVPYQVRLGRFGATLGDSDATTNADSDPDESATESDDTTVGVGLDSAADIYLPADGTPASVTAFDAARDLGASPNAVLTLAGIVAAGHTAGHHEGAGESAHILEAARKAGVERRPGVGVPTDDLADGLAHSTLAHADYSGDTGAVQATLAELGLPAELDESAQRRVASEFALAVAGADAATDRAAETVERALRPYVTPHGPFATIEGYADVLEAVTRERPGTGVAVALGHDARTNALEAWRTHAERAHEALREGTTGRYDGLFALRTDEAPVETVAGLLRDFRSPEPVALVVSEAEAAAAAVEDHGVGAAIREAAQAVGGSGGGTPTRGYAEFDTETDTTEFLSAFREARA